MRLKELIFPLLIAMVILSACNSSVKLHSEKIKELEDVVYAEKNSIPEKNKAKELISLYREHFLKYSSDTSNADYLFKAAELSNFVQDYRQSVNLYDTIISNFPDYKRAGDCMFLKGYVYDTHMQRIGLAKDAYNAFLNKYPKHELADDAKMALLYLGKTNEEILEIILKNKQDTTLKDVEN